MLTIIVIMILLCASNMLVKGWTNTSVVSQPFVIQLSVTRDRLRNTGAMDTKICHFCQPWRIMCPYVCFKHFDKFSGDTLGYFNTKTGFSHAQQSTLKFFCWIIRGLTELETQYLYDHYYF